MSTITEYTPPKVWAWNKENGGRFANINRPVSGPTHEKPLPVGKHPLQLYSLGTPNGVKVTIMLEELLALGHKGAEYDAWLMSDDAHGLGVVGGGRGSSFSGNTRVPVPLQMGTLSKAVGAYGGYLCASAPVIDLIRNRARTLIYSTGLPPATVAACSRRHVSKVHGGRHRMARRIRRGTPTTSPPRRF